MKAASDLNVDSVLEAIHQVVGASSKEHPIGLHEPDFRGTHAWQYVKDCLDTGWVSTAGNWVCRLEEELCTITGAGHAVAVTNGTVALRLALHIVGVGPGDEVLLPSLSFVATANAIAHLGAVPHFVDIDPNTLGLCPAALATRLEDVAEHRLGKVVNRETGRRIAAVLPVHIFGHPAQVDHLRKVADIWDLPMVEDGAEALASWRQGIHCGLYGSVGTLSFNGNKLITTGGGGALLTNDDALAKQARHLSTTAKKSHPWAFDHDAVGWNDRLPNLNAALGVAQLENIKSRLEAKRTLAQRYAEVFAGLKGLELVEEPPGCCSNHWLVTMRITDQADAYIVQSIQQELLVRGHAAGLLLRPVWTLMNHLPMYQSCPAGSLAIAEYQAPRLINLPSSPQLLNSWAG